MFGDSGDSAAIAESIKINWRSHLTYLTMLYSNRLSYIVSTG